MRPPKDDTRTFLARIAPYVERDGARNLNKISKELSIPYQTLWSRMRTLNENGINIYPIFSPERLGLKRMRVGFKLAPDFTTYKSFFGGLHQAAGLIYYARSFFSQCFDTEFLVPRGKEAELRKLMRTLEEMKFVSDVRVRELLWKDILMAQIKYYDYENSTWDIDFSTLKGDPSIELPEICTDETKFDQTDLVIIKSLQIKSSAKHVEIAKELGVTPEDVSYHLNRHVFELKQVQGFRMKWNGPREAWSKHSIFGVTLVFDKLSQEETSYAMSVLSAVPFTWSHMKAKDGAYLAELVVPMAELSETMRYISEKLRTLDLTPLVEQIDSSCVSNYTIPYMMHDSEKGWRFNAEESLGYILEMIKVYK